MAPQVSGCTKCHFEVPLVPMVWRALFMERCVTIILSHFPLKTNCLTIGQNPIFLQIQVSSTCCDILVFFSKSRYILGICLEWLVNFLKFGTSTSYFSNSIGSFVSSSQVSVFIVAEIGPIHKGSQVPHPTHVSKPHHGDKVLICESSTKH